MSMIFRSIGALSKTLAQAMAPSAVLILALVIYTGFAVPPGLMVRILIFYGMACHPDLIFMIAASVLTRNTLSASLVLLATVARSCGVRF